MLSVSQLDLVLISFIYVCISHFPIIPEYIKDKPHHISIGNFPQNRIIKGSCNNTPGLNFKNTQTGPNSQEHNHFRLNQIERYLVYVY